jgi:hypothetical protein
VAHQVHQVGGVFTVVDGTIGIEADAGRRTRAGSGADAVEGAGPGQCIGHDATVGCRALRRRCAARARVISAAARRENVSNKMRLRIGAVDDQMRDAVRQRIGLARTGAGDHQQRAARGRACGLLSRQSGYDAEFHRLALFGVEFFQIVDVHAEPWWGGEKETILLVFYTVFGGGYKKGRGQSKIICEVMKDRQWILQNG